MIKKHGQIIFAFSPNSRQFNFVVTNGSKLGAGSYFGQFLLHTLRASSHSYTFMTDDDEEIPLENCCEVFLLGATHREHLKPNVGSTSQGADGSQRLS